MRLELNGIIKVTNIGMAHQKLMKMVAWVALGMICKNGKKNLMIVYQKILINKI